ncbi:cobalt-precorrin 5A hydrolase [Clostridium perfringens]|uniref:cobalt-precorrin 5A hydrolase n=1 Tax=Clostridium perfringens TaxID=1502 RepID=UPI0024BC55EB|nr:cobalt-precorrin 5A hydrolase [Clostridium perfringens]ELU5588158.1 cobalt-precorrin 5A hydrolase [Clostridium perfringens]MDU3845067.1 cobalt-precorrin 5A hydrolase [Clostridium perfringens]MDU7547949.1 cobalt-precorrin 5A hydrolase [Clostridium perfringens]
MIGIISVTEKGDFIGDKLKDFFEENNISFKGIYKSKCEDFSLKGATQEMFETCKNIIFISSTGIAVRAITPFIVKKDKDPGIVVVDVNNKFTISLAGGHIGGANELTLEVSKVLNNTPVITTATDNQNKVAPDMVAKSNNLIIEDLKKAKDMASRLVNNKKVYFLDDNNLIKLPLGYESTYLLKDNTLWITNKEKSEEENLKGVLRLIRKNILLGVGCRKGVPSQELIDFVKSSLKDLNIDKRAVLKIGSIDLKKEEKAILDLSEYLNCPFETFSKDEIKSVQDEFEGSDFVEKSVGVRAVSEPAVLLMNGNIIVNKLKKNGMTLTIGELKR